VPVLSSLKTNVVEWVQRFLAWFGRKTTGIAAFVSPSAKALAWPPSEHVERLRTYAEGHALFLGKHREVFVGTRHGWKHEINRPYIGVNILGRMTRVLTSRLFGEGITTTVPEDATATGELLEFLYADCDLHRVLLEAGRGASYRGDALLKVIYDAKAQRLRVVSVNPALCYPETSPLDATEIVAWTIGQVLHRGRESFLWLERHELREEGEEGAARVRQSWVVNRLFRLKGEIGATSYSYDPTKDELDLKALEATAGLEPEVPTGVDDLLVIHIPNRTTQETGAWGVSDYEGLLGLQGELNNRLTQWGEVEDKFVHPKMIGPALADAQGNVNVADVQYLQRVAGIMPESGGLDIVTWDAQLTAVDNHVKHLLRLIPACGDLDPCSIMPPESGGPISGRALRLSQPNTQAAVQDKQTTFGPGLQRIFSVASKLAVALGPDALAWKPKEGVVVALEPDAITIVWSDGLPSDTMEMIEEQSLRLADGTQDPVEAIMALDGMGREEAEEKLARIKETKQAAMPALPQVGGSRFKPVGPAAEVQAAEEPPAEVVAGGPPGK